MIRVVRARKRPGAGTALRTASHGFVAVLALLVNSCGGTSNGSYGTPVVTLTDSNGDFTSYSVTVTGITLTRTDGYAPLLPPFVNGYSERVDFTRLSDVAELLEAPALASGTYTSASITLDYSTAAIWVDVNGQSQTATVVDSSGNLVTSMTAPSCVTMSSPRSYLPGVAWETAADIEARETPGATVKVGTVTSTALVVADAGADTVVVSSPSANRGALAETR